ncbi:sigma 54-interacting transcriptional regulator [Hyphomicrobium sp.]|uniref:sigma 54-interacting transcriptional regulator n=1 Tax=Hyphomicrobium sp. TaxID=82 RepID=UPI0025BDBA88|nr:sigma 54-interacting transcriptional regulator [Hyphomicrobium sp.]MCC7254188.1 sigma 54-interacting transcriptional regulator [Hyphomicrobium sp.]
MPGLGLAFEHCADASLAIDPHTDRIVDVNQRGAELFGRTREELRGAKASDLHPGQLGALIVFSQAVLLKGRYWTQSLAPRHADGRALRLAYMGSRIPRRGGDWLLVAMTDIEERQRHLVNQEADLYMKSGVDEWQHTERYFLDLERENRLILRAAGEGIYGVNAEGLTTFVNPAAERMLGWKASELVGCNMHDMVHHSHVDGSAYENADCPIYAAFRDGAVHQIDTEVFWRKDGRPLFVEYTSTPIRERGRLIGAVIVFRDVTQRRESEARLQNAMEEVERLRQRLELENAYLKEEIELHHGEIVGASPPMQKVLRQIQLVAETDATVLITGESGTGKEMIARAIHEASLRKDRPLIRVNCAAIPRTLFESEFFGHAKGAFTGAIRDRVGRFELADGATLFLDEVGEIPLELQSKLLRVLQEQQFERVGETRTRNVDVRIIAATNRSLDKEVKAGRFREDLYYRLEVFPIYSAPLRERREDIALLAQHALETISRRLKLRSLSLTKGDIERLRRYDWPGNVRELENVIERAAILAVDGRLRIDLPAAPTPVQIATSQSADGDIVDEAERRARDRKSIIAALEAANGKVFGKGGAAELLGVRPTTLTSRIKALKIETKPRPA